MLTETTELVFFFFFDSLIKRIVNQDVLSTSHRNSVLEWAWYN